MRTFVVVEQGVKVAKRNGELMVKKAGEAIHKTRLEGLGSLQLFGGVELTSGAIRACLNQGTDISFFTITGRYRGRITGPASKNGTRRLEQYRRVSDPAFRLQAAKALITGKITNQRNLLMRGQRRAKIPENAPALGQMRRSLQRVPDATSHDELMGIEGYAASLYFVCLGRLIKNSDFTFTKRTRRPPRDPINAALSFGYTVLTSNVDGIVQAQGLDPMLGFLHGIDYGRPSLALDLIEEMRPVIVDALVLAMVNRLQLSAFDFEAMRSDLRADQEAQEAQPGSPDTEHQPATGAAVPQPKPAGILLNDRGRRVFLAAFAKRLNEKIYYPPLEGAYTIGDILRKQVEHLIRVIDGRDERYVPFVPR